MVVLKNNALLDIDRKVLSMIECIAIDMDGTLINSNQTVSKENADAISLAQSHGVEVVIATGRSYLEAIYPLKEAMVNCPLLCVNGAETRSPKGERLAAVPLEQEQIEGIIKILNNGGLYYEIYTSEGTYTNDYDKAMQIIMDIFMSASLKGKYDKMLEEAKARFEKGLVKLVDDYGKIIADPNIDIYKFIAFSFDEKKLLEGSVALSKVKELAVSSSGKENLEITNIKAQKGNTLERFVSQRGISLKNTMAIGDNFNDLSMFEKAGRAVAMGNAPEDVKKFADTITDTNDRNGVAKAIHEVLRINQKISAG